MTADSATLYTPDNSLKRQATMTDKESKLTIYHNPRCTKSRMTLQLLQEREEEIQIIEYLEEAPDSSTLREILYRLDMQPRDLMRKQEPIYTELELDRPELNEAELIQAMVDYPILIERPIVLNGDKAAIGRPPENVLEIL